MNSFVRRVMVTAWCVVILMPGVFGDATAILAEFNVDECVTASIELGGFSLMEDIAVAGDRAWGVADQGILVLEHGNWRVFQSTPGIWLNSVDAREGDGWITGGSGNVLRLQDDEWIEASPPFEASFLDVSIAGPGDAWVVGTVPDDDSTKSLVARNRGGEWRVVEHPSGMEATAVFMLSPSLGWIAVADEDGSRLLQWDGTALHETVHPPIIHDLLSIHGSSKNNIWAGGGFWERTRGGSESALLHFDGESWTAIDVDFRFKIREVHVVDDNDAWAVGSAGNIIRFDGTRWNPAFGSGVSVWGFGSIGYFDEEDIWFAGSNQVVHRKSGEYSFWGGDRYGSISRLESVSVAPDGAIWATGWGGPVLRRGKAGYRVVERIPSASWVARVFIDRDGRAWFAYSPPEPKGFLAVPSDDGWTRVEIPTQYPIIDMHFGKDGRVWALASRSRRFGEAPPGSDVLRLESGEWSTIREMRDGDIIYAMDVVDDDSAWFAGNAISKLDGEDWNSFPIPGSPGPELLVDVSFESPDKGWFVGSKSLITFDAGSWSTQTLARDSEDGSVTNVRSTGTGSVLAAGSLGVFLIGTSSTQRIEVRTSSPRRAVWTDMTVMAHGDQIDAWFSSSYETIGHVSIRCEDAPDPTPKPESQPIRVYFPLTVSRY